MQRHIRLLTPLVIAVTLAGCTTRFLDDFEADAVGAPPLTAPAGAPDDQVFILDGTGSIRVSSTSPIQGTKSLRMRGPAMDNASAPVTFMYAEQLANPSQPVYALWSGRLSSGASARVFFWTGHFSAMIRVELRNGEVRANDALVGSYTPNQTHSILLRATPSGDSFGISVTGAGSGSATGTVLNPGDFPQGNIGLSMHLTGANADGSYVIDSVSMSERNPPERRAGS